jgi:ribosomal subunit interface protein
MNLQLTGHHLEVTPALRDYIASKLSKISNHFDHVIDIKVTLSVAMIYMQNVVTRICTAQLIYWRIN